MSKDAQQDSIHSGSSFDDSLEEEGIRNEVEGEVCPIFCTSWIVSVAQLLVVQFNE
jgi:hypothetical protein